MDVTVYPENGKIPESENWTDSLAISFINDQLNYWTWYYPIDEYRVDFINHWKCFIWLEKVGFSFWGNDYRGRICDFFENTGLVAKLDLESISIKSNNLLIFKIRNVCREILNIQTLSETDFISSMNVQIIDWRSSEDLAEGDTPLDSASCLDDKIDRKARDLVEIIKSQYADRLKVWQLAYKKSLVGSRDEFTDCVTGVGHIPLIHCEKSERIIFGVVLLDIVIKYFYIDLHQCDAPDIKGKYIDMLRCNLITSIEVN